MMAAELSTQGIERSMPPPMMTKVWPSATMPTNAARTTVERMFEAERKPGENMAVTRSRTTMPA